MIVFGVLFGVLLGASWDSMWVLLGLVFEPKWHQKDIFLFFSFIIFPDVFNVSCFLKVLLQFQKLSKISGEFPREFLIQFDLHLR